MHPLKGLRAGLVAVIKTTDSGGMVLAKGLDSFCIILHIRKKLNFKIRDKLRNITQVTGNTLAASRAKHTLRVFHFHASGCQGQWFQNTVQCLQSLFELPLGI